MLNGVAIRSQARWVEYGEKNYHSFLRLEKQHCDKKVILFLKNVNGRVVYDQQLISSGWLIFIKHYIMTT